MPMAPLFFQLTKRGLAMFEKANLDALFGELDKEWRGKPEHEQLTRDAHLGIARLDGGRELQAGIDARVKALIDKHKP